MHAKFKNPKVALYHDHLENLEMDTYDLPKTNIEFDTWDSSPFTEHSKNAIPKFKDKDLENLWRWANGHTIKALGLHRQTFHRILKKFVRETMERQRHTSQD